MNPINRTGRPPQWAVLQQALREQAAGHGVDRLEQRGGELGLEDRAADVDRLTLTVEFGTGEPPKPVIARIFATILAEITVGGAEITKLAVETNSPTATADMHELPDDQLEALIDAAQVTADAERVLTHAVISARHTGATWDQIADAVGLTRYAAKRRWPNHQHHPIENSTSVAAGVLNPGSITSKTSNAFDSNQTKAYLVFHATHQESPFTAAQPAPIPATNVTIIPTHRSAQHPEA